MVCGNLGTNYVDSLDNLHNQAYIDLQSYNDKDVCKFINAFISLYAIKLIIYRLYANLSTNCTLRTNLPRFYQAIGQNLRIYCITLPDYFAKNAQLVEIY